MEVEYDGVEYDGVEYDGVKYDGVEYDGVEYDGVAVPDGSRCCHLLAELVQTGTVFVSRTLGCFSS